MSVEQNLAPFHPGNSCQSTSYTGSVGRPRIDIKREQLEYLIENNISIPDIAGVLGICVSTVKRRLRKHDLSIIERRTPITDADLDTAVQNVYRQFPNAGYRRVLSQWEFVMAIRVTRRRVREAMQRTNPEGVTLRWHYAL